MRPLSVESIVRPLRACVERGAARPELGPELDPGFGRLALGLFAFQFESVGPYRRFCEALGRTPSGVDRWQDIPAVPAAAFKEFELTSVPASQRRAVFHSSGTTQTRPSRHFHSAASLALYEQSLKPWFARHLLPAGDRPRLLSLIPDSRAVPHSSLAHMMTVVMAQAGPGSRSLGTLLPDGSWGVDAAAFLEEASQAQHLGNPLLMAGTAFGWVTLLDRLSELGADARLPSGSRVMETGGYKGRSRALPKADLYRELTRVLGIPDSHLISEYGMSELSSQAYDRVVGDLAPRRFRFPPWCACRILSPETGRDAAPGERGLLTLYDLANVGSVLAVQTEDLAVAHEDGFSWVGRASLAGARGCSLMTA